MPSPVLVIAVIAVVVVVVVVVVAVAVVAVAAVAGLFLLTFPCSQLRHALRYLYLQELPLPPSRDAKPCCGHAEHAEDYEYHNNDW